jgi:hypothetical protein
VEIVVSRFIYEHKGDEYMLQQANSETNNDSIHDRVELTCEQLESYIKERPGNLDLSEFIRGQPANPETSDFIMAVTESKPLD